jgi:hypothetical protein
VYCCMWCSALGVVAVVLWSWCVVLCTVCEFVLLYYYCVLYKHNSKVNTFKITPTLRAECIVMNFVSYVVLSGPLATKGCGLGYWRIVRFPLSARVLCLSTKRSDRLKSREFLLQG